MTVVVVMEWERVVRFRDGLLRDVLEPGRHRARRGDKLVRVDLRPQLLTLHGQELLTADSLSIRVSALVRWRSADPRLFVTASAAPVDELYATVQLGLRDAVTAAALDELVAQRTRLVDGLADRANARVAEFGVVVDEVAVRDVMLPGEIRRAMAETVLAREQGKAELERARAEAAALRSLANTARLLEEHPALLHLRTLQAAGPGTTLVVAPAP